jgi:hypothetical protein
MAWPPKSPDLTLLVFFLWGHITTPIGTSPVDSEEDLIARIVETAATIRQQPDIFERTRQSVLRRCWLFIEVGGRRFDHLLEIGTNCFVFYFFSQNTSVVFLDFQLSSDPISRSVALQGRISDIQLPDNKSLFCSPRSYHEVWARGSSAPCIQLVVIHSNQFIIVNSATGW